MGDRHTRATLLVLIHSQQRLTIPRLTEILFLSVLRQTCPRLFTGARYGNVAAMRWTEIDFDRMIWTIPAAKAKSDRPIIIALSPPAIAILRSRLERADASPYVFSVSGTARHVGAPHRPWDRFRAASGLTDLRIHDLRRSLGSWQAVAGASLAVIGASLGHANLKSTRVYAKLTLEPVRQSVDNAVAAMLAAGGVKLLEGHSTPVDTGGGNGKSYPLAYVRAGRAIRYRLADIEQFMLSRTSSGT